MKIQNKLIMLAIIILLAGCSSGGGRGNGNHKPVSMPESLSLLEDSSLDIELNATDEDNDSITYEITSPPSHGLLSGTAPSITYTPDTDYSGTDSFKFTASDDTDESDEAIIDISVMPVNDDPVPADDNVTTDEDKATIIDVLGNDKDADRDDKLHIASATAPKHGTAIIKDNKILYTPAQDYHGDDNFTYISSDGNGGDVGANVTITVVSVNDMPVAKSQSLTEQEDNTLDIKLQATDADNDLLTYKIAKQPTHGTLSGSAPDIIYTPSQDYNGDDSFKFTAYDGKIDSNEATINIALSPVNDDPVPADDNATTDEDTATTIDVLVNDIEVDKGDVLRISIVTTPTHGVATIQDNKIHYSPHSNYHGNDSIIYEVTDGNGAYLQADVNITVISINDAPVAKTTSDVTIPLGDSTVLSAALSTDVDDDALEYEWRLDGDVASTDMYFIYVGRELGSFEFTLKVTDPDGLSSEATTTVIVTAAQNSAPAQYKDVFYRKPPVVSPLEDTAISKDITDIKAKGDDLISEAEAIIASKKFTLDVKPLTDEEREEIANRKKRIEQEVSDHEN